MSTGIRGLKSTSPERDSRRAEPELKSGVRRTGQIALAGGRYTCKECGRAIDLGRGEPLPWCRHCLRRAEWRQSLGVRGVLGGRGGGTQ